MKLFRKRYRTDSMRLPGRDYSQPGRYFVTVCTKDRNCWFGSIRRDIVSLNDIGCIAADELQRTASIRPEIIIDRWIVMPNHLHAIIIIDPPADDDVETSRLVETSRRDVSTWIAELIPLCRLRPRSLGAVVNHIKAAATKRIRRLGYHNFSWQPLFHDRIIRNEKALYAARNYIVMNP